MGKSGLLLERGGSHTAGGLVPPKPCLEAKGALGGGSWFRDGRNSPSGVVNDTGAPELHRGNEELWVPWAFNVRREDMTSSSSLSELGPVVI